MGHVADVLHIKFVAVADFQPLTHVGFLHLQYTIKIITPNYVKLQYTMNIKLFLKLEAPNSLL